MSPATTSVGADKPISSEVLLSIKWADNALHRRVLVANFHANLPLRHKSFVGITS